jgi:Tfp pilus assembly major pilin PilA
MIVELLGGIRATIFAVLAALLLIVAAVQHVEVRHYKVAATGAKAEVVAIKAANAAELAAQRAIADAKEKARAAATAAAERQMMQDNADADQKYKDTIAGLRAGTVRLRHEWTCPVLPRTTTTPESSDADTVLREQDASNLVRLAAEADAQIRALQAILMGERQ